MNINKKEIIDSILKSNEFKGSTIYKDLLSYLFAESEKGKIPKEHTIAIELFHKDSSELSSGNSNLRVYIHNLRKKLDGYYRNEGNNDPVKIMIPKGSYTIKYIVDKPARNKVINRRIVYSSFALLVLLLVFKLIKTSYPKNDYVRSDVWQDLLVSEKPLLIVLGDYFVYIDTSNSSPLLMRDFHVNSIQDFEDKFTSDEYPNYHLTDHTFLTKSIPVGLSKLIPVLVKNNISYDVKLSSNLQWNDMKENNIIYLGSFKTLYKIENQLARNNINYNIDNNTLQVIDPEGTVTHTYTTRSTIHDGEMIDYALMAKLKGPQENLFYMFVSTHDIGLLSIIDQLTNPVLLNEFEASQLKNISTSFFEVIHEVTGFNKTEFERNQVYFKSIFY